MLQSVHGQIHGCVADRIAAVPGASTERNDSSCNGVGKERCVVMRNRSRDVKYQSQATKELMAFGEMMSNRTGDDSVGGKA
jgi:hypothetical protein